MLQGGEITESNMCKMLIFKLLKLTALQKHDPSKQGLKLLHTTYLDNPKRLQKHDPAKQGLKPFL